MVKRKIYVGGTLEDAAGRVAEIWNKAARGEAVEPEGNVTFVSWSALSKVMTDRRHELLRHLHRTPALSLRSLARDLGRDYKRVHEDVAALTAVGLIRREGRTLPADYSAIETRITL